jgi:branched-subunit amino acid ABC-type transport system permease component
VLLLSLVVVVLGSPGSVGGTLLAALAVGEIQTLGVALAPTAAPFLLFAAMALVLAVRARGLRRRWSTA